MNASTPKREDDFVRSVEENTPEPTEWTDIKAIYAREDNIVENLIKGIIDVLSPKGRTVAKTVALASEPLPETSDELALARGNLEWNFLQTLEREKGLTDLHSELVGDDSSSEGVRIIFTCKKDTLYPILMRHMREIGARHRKAEAERRAQEKKSFWITYDKTSRKIFLNGKLPIHRLHVDSNSTRFFEYVWYHPRRQITRKDLKRCKYDATTKFKSVVSDLGFKKELEALFFPTVKKNVLTFRDIVYENELLSENIDVTKIKEKFANARKIKHKRGKKK